MELGTIVRRVVVVAGLAVLAAQVGLGTPATALDTAFTPRVAPDALGVNGQHVAYGVTPTVRDAHLAAIAAGGVTVVRTDLLANVADDALPLDSTYDWGAGTPDDYDVWVRALAQHGLRWAPSLNGSPSWARPPGCSHTCSPTAAWYDDWATFAAAAVDRYGVGGRFWSENPDLTPLPPTTWEVWNEPNLGWSTLCPTHTPGVDAAPREYAVFLRKVTTAIHAADPDATVLAGGVADVPGSGSRCTAAEFVRGVHAQDATILTTVDGIALHEYQPTPAAVRAGISAFRSVLDHELGAAATPLHLNEVGWGTAPGTLLAVDDAVRGQHLAEVADTVLRSRCGVLSVSPYAWRTPERDPVLDEFDWFGIADHDATPKASGEAYLAQVRTLRGLGPTAPETATFDDGSCSWRADPAGPAPAVAEAPATVLLLLGGAVAAAAVVRRRPT